MRFIQKTSVPKWFLEDIEKLSNWNDYSGDKKRKLKQHILKEEQNYICCYCESKVKNDNEMDDSHIEHIKPKSLDLDNLTFDYTNLSISCNGTCQNNKEDYVKYNCGHKKSNDYDEEKFLNPTTLQDIRSYFIYNENAEILPSLKNNIKAQYTIDLLHLNSDKLPLARAKALKDFELFGQESEEEDIKKILKCEDIAFISYLKYMYRFLF
jgi:uncharacterized protein (TIGR02646 family)